MLQISDVKGVIFDVDDTLLDNNSGIDPKHGLHALSRLAAVHEIGTLRGIPQLESLTPQENVDAFLNAPVHTIDGAVWSILRMNGLVEGDEVDYTNELLVEIAALKNATHEAVIRAEGKALPGASEFVRALAAHGLQDKMAIASGAILRDINIALEVMDIQQFFPIKHIISNEMVTHPKPDPEPFNLAFSALRLQLEDRGKVLAFEDDPRGIVSAKAAGLFVCAITTRFRKDDMILLNAKPDLIADSYEEFCQLLGLPSLNLQQD